MESIPLLNLLADGAFRSGEELGAALGVSRAAVWKQVQRLQQETGLSVVSAKGRGYALERALELISSERVRDGTCAEALALLTSLECHALLDSTNSRALERAQQEPELSGLVVTAECQSAGRGRRGRNWVSPFGRNLYCSILWRYETGVAALEGLSLAVGVAVVRALQDNDINGVQLKWPNDLIWRHRKVAGVLLEMSGDPSGAAQVIIGIGINVGMAGAIETAEIDQPWADLCEVAGRPVYRNALLASMLSRLLPLLASYEKDGFARWQDDWQALDALHAAQVVVHMGSTRLTGEARGVTSQGALQVLTAAGLETIHGGEVSLRSA